MAILGISRKTSRLAGGAGKVVPGGILGHGHQHWDGQYWRAKCFWVAGLAMILASFQAACAVPRFWDAAETPGPMVPEPRGVLLGLARRQATSHSNLTSAVRMF